MPQVASQRGQTRVVIMRAPGLAAPSLPQDAAQRFGARTKGIRWAM